MGMVPRGRNAGLPLRLRPLLMLGLVVGSVASVARGESPYLVRDLSPGADELASVEPRGLLTAGRRVFF